MLIKIRTGIELNTEMDLRIAMGTITRGCCLVFTLVYFILSLNVVDPVSSSNL